MKKLLVLLVIILASCSKEEIDSQRIQQEELQLSSSRTSELISEDVEQMLIGKWELENVEVENPLRLPLTNCSENIPTEDYRIHIKNTLLEDRVQVEFKTDYTLTYGGYTFEWELHKDKYDLYFIYILEDSENYSGGEYCINEYREKLAVTSSNMSFSYKCLTAVPCVIGEGSFFGADHLSTYIFKRL